MPEQSLRGVFAKPFAEQAEFFRRKLNLPSERWDDIRRDQHDRGFIVAGAMKADLVADFRAAIQKAIDEGKSIQWFRGEFDRIVARHGWAGWTGEGTKGGVAWRTRVIYATNLRTSYQAGRWAQMTDPDVMAARPYWRYVHRSVEHPRLNHKAWHNTVLPAGHSWFSTHYPPNGWGCQCSVRGLWPRDLAAMGKDGPDEAPEVHLVERLIGQRDPRGPRLVLVPAGIDPGFEYIPGSSRQRGAAQGNMGQ